MVQATIQGHVLYLIVVSVSPLQPETVPYLSVSHILHNFRVQASHAVRWHSAWVYLTAPQHQIQIVHSWQGYHRNDAVLSAQCFMYTRCQLKLPITGDINLDHLVRLVYAGFLYHNDIIFPFVTGYYLLGVYSEIIPILFTSSYYYPPTLACLNQYLPESVTTGPQYPRTK